MLLDCDLSGIEWRCAAFLSQDPIMIQEIIDGDDIHTSNAIAFFGGKEFRQDCKVFNFRMIYGGSPYAFYMDPTMPNYTLDRWTEIHAAFYKKYSTLKKKHDAWIMEQRRTGKIVSPTGRILKFKKVKKSDGSIGYKETQAVNYPVQSLATADIAPLAVCVSCNRIRDANLSSEFIGTVHDSNLFDCLDESSAILTAKIVINTFRELPDLIEKYFGFKFNVPLTGEAKIGDNWGEMKKLEI